MTALSTSVVGLNGAAPTFVAATAGGDTAVTGAGVVLLVKNDAASAVTVTIATPGKVNGLDIADRNVTVAAGAIHAIPLGSDYTDPATGRASFTYSSATTVNVAVIRVAV